MSVGDDRLTASRDELKYLVDQMRVDDLVRRLDGILRPHHYAADSPVAPMTRHYTTTVYFDTDARDLYRAARSEHGHTKLRAREYYDVLPLDELATNERDLLRSSPLLWIELKDRDGDHTGKRRVGVPKRRLRQFFEQPEADAELIEIQTRTHGTAGEGILASVIEFVSSFSEPLRPSCIVNYRRDAWQNPSATTRVTLDRELGAYLPDDALWEQERTLTRRILGTPKLADNYAIVEVKRLGSFPEDLADILEAVDARPTNFSKFVTASTAVYGRPSELTALRGSVSR